MRLPNEQCGHAVLCCDSLTLNLCVTHMEMKDENQIKGDSCSLRRITPFSFAITAGVARKDPLKIKNNASVGVPLHLQFPEHTLPDGVHSSSSAI